MASLWVLKFGGTSLGTPERIRSVAERIALERGKGRDLVVVVSAMGHTTDELIELAHRVSATPPPREMDMLLTAGERISMALVAMALADQGVRSVSLTGSQSGILTDRAHRRARIRRILGDRIRTGLAEGRVVIVAGFQGVSEEGKDVTTLGRGGSDTTAVALAASLGAERCRIYTDVAGVFSADPRTVPAARLWDRLPTELMIELATRGAGVLHPRSAELAATQGVRLEVLSSLEPGPGTEIFQAKEREMERFKVIGVTADRGKTLVRVELARTTALGSLWELSSAESLSLVSPQFSGARVEFYVERDALGEWRAGLDRLTSDGFVKEYRFDEHLVPVSVVGYRFSQDAGALDAMVGLLTQCEIFPESGVSSALAATFAIRVQDVDEALKALHHGLCEN